MINYTTNQQIMSNVLADMIYASAYWIQEVRTSIPYVKLQGTCVEDKWFDCLSRGGKLIIIDNENYEKHEINFKQLSKAIFSIKNLSQFKDETAWDETFTDSIIQTAIFGKLIFN